MVHEPIAVTEMFKALGDPIRWSILQQIAQQEELACSALEDTLPVSKPTISYHTKILSQAGLIEVCRAVRLWQVTGCVENSLEPVPRGGRQRRAGSRRPRGGRAGGCRRG